MDLRDAWSLAHELLERHGLVGWTIELDQAKRRAGVCRHGRKVIGLSAPITRLHPEAEVRDTILHEIAHALVGPEAGHGPVWAETARRIGCSGERCVPEDAPRVPGAWVGVCREGHMVERHRRPERVLMCGRCDAPNDVDRVFEWVHHGRPAAMHPNYVAELAAMRDGRRMTILPPGATARVVAPGEFSGRVGTVAKVGRTSYHLRLPEGLLRVVFAAVEPA
ncbi:SprT-like domain-containing protein [Nocardioides cheoyonin]|uniref:SprT-like domain-containing protein n=1 Tax=Nocardioides cheoyonin TaxID=3156615 RepID=UPI0032B3DB22